MSFGRPAGMRTLVIVQASRVGAVLSYKALPFNSLSLVSVLI